MDYKTKDYYRNKIKEISKETKISEIYIANKALDLARENYVETLETSVHPPTKQERTGMHGPTTTISHRVLFNI